MYIPYCSTPLNKVYSAITKLCSVDVQVTLPLEVVGGGIREGLHVTVLVTFGPDSDAGTQRANGIYFADRTRFPGNPQLRVFVAPDCCVSVSPHAHSLKHRAELPPHAASTG